MPKTRLAKGAARAHILNTAGLLFYRFGIRAIGVDTVVAEAGVAKTTLYDHFPSKDDLITAYLAEQDAAFWVNFEATLAQHPHAPRQQILDLFTMFETMIATPQSLGCPFLSAAAEFPELDQPGHQVAFMHKNKLWQRLQELAQAAGAAQPDQLADQLLLLLDGAFASKRVFRSADSPIRQLRATVEMVLKMHLN